MKNIATACSLYLVFSSKAVLTLNACNCISTVSNQKQAFIRLIRCSSVFSVIVPHVTTASASVVKSTVASCYWQENAMRFIPTRRKVRCLSSDNIPFTLRYKFTPGIVTMLSHTERKAVRQLWGKGEPGENVSRSLAGRVHPWSMDRQQWANCTASWVIRPPPKDDELFYGDFLKTRLTKKCERSKELDQQRHVSHATCLQEKRCGGMSVTSQPAKSHIRICCFARNLICLAKSHSM